MTVSSAFMSSRRERIRFSVLLASGFAFRTAIGEALSGFAFTGTALAFAFDAGLADLDFTREDLAEDGFFEAGFLEADFAFVVLDLDADLAFDLDNTDVARDHSFHCIAAVESDRPAMILRMWG